MSDLDKFRSEQLQDPEFLEYYLDMQPAADISKAIIGARMKLGITQQELARRSGVIQGDISRLESCEGSPTLKTLKRIAKALNMRVKIEFIPLDDAFESNTEEEEK